MLDEGGKTGAIEVEKDQDDQNVFQLKDITAEDAMTPRLYVFSLDGNLRLWKLKSSCITRSISAFPSTTERSTTSPAFFTKAGR